MMAIKKNLLKIALLVVFLLLCFISGIYLSKAGWKKRAITAEDNYASSKIESQKLGDGFALTLKLTEEQFEAELNGYVDSINTLNDEKIKLSRILRFTQFQLEQERKNIKVETRDSFIYGDTVRIGRKAWLRDSCMSVEVFAPDTGSYVYFTTKLSIKGSLIVYEGLRRNQHTLFGMNIFRSGKRLTTAKMNTNCDGAELDVKDIEVIRK